MQDCNPYASPSIAELSVSRIRSAIRPTLWWMVFLQPVATVTLIYVCWLVSYASLGEAPKFGEHPSTEPAHTFFHVLGTVAALSLLGSPILFVVGLGWSLAQPFATTEMENAPRSSRLLCGLAFVTMAVLSVGILYLDPWDVLYWFVD